MEDLTLIKKYNTPGPRYTSYPTVPFWEENQMNQVKWLHEVGRSFWNSHKEISLYIHLPFCESLCTYCGCNTRITKNHAVEEVYMAAVMKEWKMYLASFPDKPLLRELHLGGGTPTFFSSENLAKLISHIKDNCIIPDEVNFSFEGHPANTTPQHLQTLYDLGFRRVSFGIQDFDPRVQKIINRKQSEEQVMSITETARQIGYDSVNYDLIYGLPGQTLGTLQYTLEKTAMLRPSRIAFYGYAHIPWLKPAQKSFEHLLPDAELRMEMYMRGKAELLQSGYIDIGMDHFALATDDLYKAAQKGDLHRNFMGYTTQETSLMIGLGVSSVSDTWTGFSQNHKDLKDYYQSIKDNTLPISKGHFHTKQDSIVRKHILNLMCHYETYWTAEELDNVGVNFDFELLEQMINDYLIEFNEFGIKILDKGKPFVRNVCMAIDARLSQRQLHNNMFSKTV